MPDEAEATSIAPPHVGIWKLSDDGKTIVSEGSWPSQEEAILAAKKFIDEMLLNER